MLTMQAFYTQLFSRVDVHDTHLRCLTQLAQASLGQLAALKNDLSWGPWDNEAG